MDRINRVKEKIGPFYLVLCFLSFFLLDYPLRKTNISYSLLELYDKIPLYFVLGWCCILCGIIHILPGLIKKIFMGASILIFGILTLVNGGYINIFNKFFSFADLFLLGEGTEFMDTSYIHIRKIVVLSVVLSVLLMVLSIYLVPEKRKKYEIFAGIFLFAVGVGGILYSDSRFSNEGDAMAWDAASNVSLIYREFTDTPKCMLMCGLYQYTFRDFCNTFNPVKNLQNAEMIDELDSYFEESDVVHENNEKTGMFKGKNLILIQLENIDEWMLTEQNMPNMYKLKEEGIDFVNHYSPAFATGKTFNTEFIANTSWIPMTSGGASSQIYVENSYPYSLAHLFKSAGYGANSFHSASGWIYNREEAHYTFGYDEYHDSSDMNMDDYTMDSQMTNGFDIMIEENPFFDFIITYSGHGPFSEENSAAQAHLDEVKEYADLVDETYLAGLAQAKETDEFVGNLIAELEESNLLDDTVLAFYTDHYSYSTIDNDLLYELKGTSDSNLLQNTPFFIWSSGMNPEKVEKVTNTSDILPTLANLFDLDTDYKYYFGSDAFDPQYKGFVMFSDFSWYDGEIYWKPTESKDPTDYEKEMSEKINEKLNISWDLLEVNYFAHKK